ncbi:hypothetical protein PpBr36_07845, partial [Pyricularia pennisetigena]|uniref:hypothetical protein n=1 Tax=Pyricularia pennisetigena TaxID=1578925 RepID=UPI001151AD54
RRHLYPNNLHPHARSDQFPTKEPPINARRHIEEVRCCWRGVLPFAGSRVRSVGPGRPQRIPPSPCSFICRLPASQHSLLLTAAASSPRPPAFLTRSCSRPWRRSTATPKSPRRLHHFYAIFLP